MQTLEKWKAITKYKDWEFDGKYEVSNWGNLRNATTKQPLATYSNGKGQGYLKTKIIDKSKKRSNACRLFLNFISIFPFVIEFDIITHYGYCTTEEKK